MSSTSPFAPQTELSGSRDAWSQLGNDHVVADASNHGYVQLWSQDRLYQWMNYYDASQRHYAGGFGYLNIAGRVLSTLYDDRPAGAVTSRTFGSGYYAKSMRVPGISEHDVVYAPFGNASLLLHDVTITNTSKATKSGSYFEYWDVNPEIQAVKQLPRGYLAPVWDRSTQRCQWPSSPTIRTRVRCRSSPAPWALRSPRTTPTRPRSSAPEHAGSQPPWPPGI